MASLEERLWESDVAGLTRRDRRPCAYMVYLPDPLAGRRLVLDGDVAADVADAETALVKLDASGAALAGTEALARLLLRAEPVASSRTKDSRWEGAGCFAPTPHASSAQRLATRRRWRCSATSMPWSGGWMPSSPEGP